MRRKSGSGSEASSAADSKPDIHHFLVTPQADASGSPDLRSDEACGGKVLTLGQLSGPHTSDGDDSETGAVSKDRRREAHTFAEQKRRDAIKHGYERLTEVVPTCQPTDGTAASKLSKAAVLQRSVEYVEFLIKSNKKQEEALEKKRKDVMALKIMLANYEHIVKTNQNLPEAGETELPEEIKFRVFQQFMDNLFLSFNSSISVSNFAELSACMINWLEEYCKPQVLKEVMHASAHHATINYRE